MRWTREATVDAAGTPIFYREAGQGPPLVLLHGFPQTGHCWAPVAEHLAPGFRVLAPDLPGYGGSGRPPAFDAATVARTVVAFMAAVGAPRATVVGHDWGGGIAYRIAGAHQEATERLVIVNSPYRELDLKRGWYMLAFNLPVLPELAFTAGMVPAFLRFGAKDPAAFGDSIEVYRKAFGPWERRANALAYYRTISRQALLSALPFRRARGRDRPGRIVAPTLIVWGEEDPALPVRLVDGIARAIPQAKIERIPGVGHFVPEEAPDVLAGMIATFARG